MSKLVQRLVPGCLILALSASAMADGPADNDPAKVRRVPKLGIDVPAAKRAELEAGLMKLRSAIDALASRKDGRITELLPDVEIYYKAVHDTLVYQEFFQPKELVDAEALLVTGEARAEQ